ncbi:hypothetical protein OJAV_G00234710 [Oryzias javanicus]|uniref:MARVEL domain-containing protein n=1 Tax=Oryzias javanicus TaxID=123683 RepID=A0A3S2NNN8_ORYJA|nr:hypothetical protein OJAV_G00234710 [Oryzias javanicus]
MAAPVSEPLDNSTLVQKPSVHEGKRRRSAGQLIELAAPLLGTITASATSLASAEPPIMPTNESSPFHLFWVRVAALLFSCVAFSVTMKGAFLPRENMSDWCMFCWVFSFTCSLIVLLVELGGIQRRIPVSWTNLTITVACYAALFCLSASVIFPVFYIRNAMHHDSKIQDYRITSTVFSCLATMFYMRELSLSRSRDQAGYMATAPGLMKVCQTFVACVIFLLVGNPVSYEGYPPLQWCMAVYYICFILSMVVVVMCVGGFTGCLSVLFPKLLSKHGFLGVAMYVSATILWPLNQFDDQHGDKSSEYSNEITVAVLTGVNLLLYLVDLAYSIKLDGADVPSSE